MPAVAATAAELLLPLLEFVADRTGTEWIVVAPLVRVVATVSSVVATTGAEVAVAVAATLCEDEEEEDSFVGLVEACGGGGLGLVIV